MLQLKARISRFWRKLRAKLEGKSPNLAIGKCKLLLSVEISMILTVLGFAGVSINEQLQSPFYQLPAEIRNRILELVLAAGEVHLPVPKSASADNIEGLARLLPSETCNDSDPRLLITCRKASIEGSALFYSCNRFYVAPGPWTNATAYFDDLTTEHGRMIVDIAMELSFADLSPKLLKDRHWQMESSDHRDGYMETDLALTWYSKIALIRHLQNTIRPVNRLRLSAKPPAEASYYILHFPEDEDLSNGLYDYTTSVAASCIRAFRQTISEGVEYPSAPVVLGWPFIRKWVVTGAWKDETLREAVVTADLIASDLRKRGRFQRGLDALA